MTKIFIIAGSILGVLLVAGTVLSLIAPKKISIASVQLIQAPVADVYDQIRFMKNYPNWSPFRLTDPQQKFSLSGIDGEQGATFHWEGVAEKSKGKQVVTGLTANKKVVIDCQITVPFESQPKFTYSLKEVDGGVEVTQLFEAEMPAPVNVIAMLTGLEKNISAINKTGLSRLKTVSEAQAKVISNN